MKTILVTGLDGSGKSTLLSRLEESLQDQIEILRVPYIEVEKFKENGDLYRTCLFVNELSKNADHQNIPQLKVVGIFASMLLFRRLQNNLQENGKMIFCERHPLVDTSVYAKFYSDKMDPRAIPASLLQHYDENYREEILFLISALNQPVETEKGLTYGFLDFIFQWFHIQQKVKKEDLRELFQIDIPDEIYYLKADPEILFARLSERKVMEPHENIKAFSMMLPVYDKVLSETNSQLNVIDANRVENLDIAYLKIFNKLKK